MPEDRDWRWGQKGPARAAKNSDTAGANVWTATDPEGGWSGVVGIPEPEQSQALTSRILHGVTSACVACAAWACPPHASLAAARARQHLALVGLAGTQARVR